MQRLADVGNGYAKVASARRVDQNLHLRLRFLIVGIEVHNARIFLRRSQYSVTRNAEGFISRTCDDEVQRLTPAPSNRRPRRAIAAHSGQFGKNFVDLCDDIFGFLGALFPWFQEDQEGSRVEVVTCGKAAGCALNDGPNRALFEQPQNWLGRIQHIFVHGVVASALRRANVDTYDTDIFGWREFGLKRREQKACDKQKADDAKDCSQRLGNRAGQHLRIARLNALEFIVHP